MLAYKYDEKTKEYLGVVECQLDPLESEQQGRTIYLLPADSTFIQPIEKEGYVNVFNGEAWELVEDNRGKGYWLDTDTYGTPSREMKELGPLPQNAVFEPPKPTEEEKQEQIKNYLKAVVQNWMDKTVQEREYDGVHTACLYVNSPIEKFQKEGQACLEWMSAVWVKCYAIQDEVLAGTREIPTEEELIAELPVLEW